MKILGSKHELAQLNVLMKEPGRFFGSNDVLKGYAEIQDAPPDSNEVSKVLQQKLYLHISDSPWSKFTGILRERLLPWRWKAVHLDCHDELRPNEKYDPKFQFQRVLVCTPYSLTKELSESIDRLAGKSLFITRLIAEGRYRDYCFGKEILVDFDTVEKRQLTKITHPMGEWKGSNFLFDRDSYTHIYRARSLYSFLVYKLLKRFSTSWKEQEICVGSIKEKVLLKQIPGETMTVQEFWDTVGRSKTFLSEPSVHLKSYEN